MKKRAGDVFVAGGQPNITYNPRTKYNLEEQLKDYLDTGYKLFSITGQTKSGKTVLTRKIVPQKKGVWVPGGLVQTEGDFWSIILDKLDFPINYSKEEGLEYTEETNNILDGGLNVGIANTKATKGVKETDKTLNKVQRQFVKNPRIRAIEALQEANKPLIIDDFHYISREIQTSIVRSLKDPIFDGLRVIVIAVPHRAYDAVKVEHEMTGRIAHLNIPMWSDEELMEIPSKGFPELNASCPEQTIIQFTKESFGSPHLIQEFCLRLCFDNDLRESTEQLKMILEPGDYSSFFKRIALSASKTAFETLARGPRQRTDRVDRLFNDGTNGDIYVAILKALAYTGPKTVIQYEEIRNALKNILAGTLPKANEVTRVLAKMSELAKRHKDGEPVLEWVTDTLYIADPFFAFYLKWYSNINNIINH